MRPEDYRLRDWDADVARGYLTVLDGVRLPIRDNTMLAAPAYDDGGIGSPAAYEAANAPEKLAAVRRGRIRLVNPQDPHHPAILFRARNNLTLDEAGHLLGVSGMAVSCWERGLHRTPADIHERIARAEKVVSQSRN